MTQFRDSLFRKIILNLHTLIFILAIFTNGLTFYLKEVYFSNYKNSKNIIFLSVISITMHTFFFIKKLILLFLFYHTAFNIFTIFQFLILRNSLFFLYFYIFQRSVLSLNENTVNTFSDLFLVIN